MNNSECRENFFGYALKLTVVPDVAAHFFIPFTSPKKVLGSGDFSFSEGGAVDVPVRKKSVSYKESEASDLAGKSYKVQVDWDMEAFSLKMVQQAEAVCKKIQSGVNHLIITIVDGEQLLVRNVEGASSFSFVDDKGFYKCSWQFHCVAGLQRLHPAGK